MKRRMLLFIIPALLVAQSKDTTFQKIGIVAKLPVFAPAQLQRLNYPDSWLSGKWKNFTEWKKHARGILQQCMFSLPPSTDFNAVVIEEEDRGTYVAQKLAVSLTVDSRVLAYLLKPKQCSKAPAVLLLHDHGARFDIGKEKMIEPFRSDGAVRDTARMWVQLNYGGKFIGDELAQRGYVCFATDALNWGHRGGAGYEDQQALASNLLNMGMSYAGLVAWEDIRCADFLATLPFVDTTRIAAIGHSFGSYRTWQLAALSDRIACGIAVCWIGTNKGLLEPGNNRTRGQSAFTTTHPGLSLHLDLPDVAGIACPKPMYFINGKYDKLFPQSDVEEAYAKMRSIWKSQNAEHNLVTELWDSGHVFSAEMQEHAFKWLDQQLKQK